MRKRLLSLTLALVMALALLPTAALAVTVTEIVPCNYDGTFLSGNFVKVYMGNDPDRKYGLFDITGKEILPCMYEDVANMDQGLIAVKLNGKWGFINQTGKAIVPCMYENAWSCGQDLIAVKLNGKSGFIDQMGKEVTPCQYEGMYNFSEGLAAVKLNGKWGFIDQTGKEVIPCKYDEVHIDRFSEGLAAVKLNGKWGFIDQASKEVIPFKYNYADMFSDGLAKVYLNGKAGFIDKTGAEVLPCTLEYGGVGRHHEGFAYVTEGNEPMAANPALSISKHGFIDITGKEVVPCKYDIARDFDQGYAAVGILSGELAWGWPLYRWGFIDTTGKEVVPCKYEALESTFFDGLADDGLARVRGVDGLWGFIDKTGKEIVPCMYEDAWSCGQDLIAVELNGKCGLFGKTGNEIVPCKYSSIGSLSEDLMHVELSDGGRTRHGYIDTTGKEVIPCKYLWAKDFKGGRALVGVDNGEKDEDGYLVGTEVTIDRTGAQIDGVMIKRGGEEQNWKWGFVDAKGREIVPYKYTSASDFSGRFANVGIDGKWGLLAIDDYVDLTVPAAPANLAYASTQSVLVDGSPVEFQAYALKDANGNDTNYIKLRDVASVLNGTAVQFNVGWDEAVNMETGKGYAPNGSEMSTPYSGDQAYEINLAETRIDGSPVVLDAIVLKDDQGGAYTYYKLRDLGAALGFRVDWTAEKGIFIETK